jgi:hypothetical protein
MRLPKVQMRSSLIQAFSNHQGGISSLPISPRVFDAAKYGSTSQKKSQNNDSLNDINLSTGAALAASSNISGN